MTKRFKFEFNFDKPDKTYHPGETIHCTVNATVYELLNVRSVLLRFMGIAYVEFPVGENKVWETKLYFTEYQTVFGMEGGSPLHVAPGDHTYEGYFTLPTNIPSSFKHENGYIDYTVKAEFEMVTEEKVDKKELYIESFYVKDLIDLEAIVYPFKPFDKSTKKVFGYGFGKLVFHKSEPLCIITKIPKLVWQPGETMPISIKITNKSDVNVKYIRLEIIEKLTFAVVRVIKKKRIHTNIIYKEIFGTQPFAEHPVVQSCENKIFESSFYIDERREYPVFNACSNIRSEYLIKVVAVTQGLHFNATHKTKIYIGYYRAEHSECDTNNGQLSENSTNNEINEEI